MSLLDGVTLGSAGSADWGSAFFGGQKIIGVAGGHLQLADGSFGPTATDADWQNIASAENAAYATQPAIDYRYQQQIDSPTTSPEVKALLQNDEFRSTYDTGVPVNYNALSPTLQALIKAVPNLYNNMIASAWTPTASTATATTDSGSAVSAPTTSGPTNVATASSPVSSLLDLVSAGTSFNHTSGVGVGASGGSGGLTISSPIASGGASSGASPVKLFILVGIGLAVWYFYHKSKKRAAA